MSRRKKIITAIIIVILLLLGLLLWWLLSRRQATVVTPTPIVNTANPLPAPVVNTNTSVPVTPKPVAPPPKPDERTNLKRIAAAFTERFGSFSSQGNYENIVELKALMTASMAEWADGYVDKQRKQGQIAGVFYGVTTRALVANVTAFDESTGMADVTVSTQRQEETNTGEKLYYQDFFLKFVRQGEVWKVDFAKWDDKKRDG
jgi:hypothetical protein